MLTAKQIKLVQDSYVEVAKISDVASQLFYNRLFELKPELKSLFKNDIEKQGKMLMQTLTVAVHSLNDLDKLIPVLQDLGRRHATYRVKDEHYDTVAAALLWTLSQGLGKAFTNEVKEAWTAVYLIIAGVMKEAAKTKIS